MRSTLIFLLITPFAFSMAAEADKVSPIAKSIQCSYLREKSFLDIYDMYSAEKFSSEYIKQVSDSIYSQAFKICDPENVANADKEILKVCSNSCDQSATNTKGVLGLGGPSKGDIEKCKKMCLDYSDHLGNHYTAAAKALKKYIEQNPPMQAPVQQSAVKEAVGEKTIEPVAAKETKEEKKDEKKE